MALEQLCRAYWQPVYGYYRSSGLGVDEAHDLTQAFFTRLIEKRDFGGARQERGRFRAYLVGCARNFLNNERQARSAEKRGGGQPSLAIDGDQAERRYEPLSRDEDPERQFQRSYALTLLERCLERLRLECELTGKRELYRALRPFLHGADELPDRAALGAQLDLKPGALKVALHRLRRRFGELLRLEIAETVDSSELVEEEIRGLFEVFQQ